MATTRKCPACQRLNGPKFARCMYCGAELPPIEDPEEGPTEIGQPDPERARELLKALSPEARAMMPPEVLQRLKDQAAGGEAKPAAPTSAPPSTPPPSTPRPSGPDPRRRTGRKRRALGGDLGPRVNTFDRIPSVSGPTTSSGIAAVPPPDEDDEATIRDGQSIPEIEHLDSGFYRPLGSQTLDELPAHDPTQFESFHDLEPVDVGAEVSSLRTAARPQMADASADGSLVGEGPVTQGLGRGAGPFGPRTASYRLILIPDPEYKGKAHWLRHRLSGTVGVDLYTAVQSLQRDTPSLLLSTEDPAEAEEKRQHLLEGELKVLLLDRRAFLDDVEPIYVVEAAGAGPGPATLTTWSGVTLDLRREAIAWAALGEIDPERARLPMVRDRTRWGGREAATNRSFDDVTAPYLLLDLYLESQRRPLRLRSDRFDFRCLGDERSLAAAMNLRLMTKWLAPDPETPIPLDDTFKRLPRIGSGGADEGDNAVPRREIDFTEYGLIRDLGRREFG